jgi:hypothetical protein
LHHHWNKKTAGSFIMKPITTGNPHRSLHGSWLMIGMICVFAIVVGEMGMSLLAQNGPNGGLPGTQGRTEVPTRGNPVIPDLRPDPEPPSFPSLPLAQSFGPLTPCATFDKTQSNAQLEEECLPALEENVKKTLVWKVPDPDAFGFLGKHAPLQR